MKDSFGSILKDLRVKRGLSQTQLAKDLSLSKGIISMWENGKREPTLFCLIKLADYFNVSIDYLAGRAGIC